LYVFHGQLLDVLLRRLAHASELPRRHIAEIIVIADRLTIFGLVFDAEVSAARLVPGQSIVTHQFSELEEICHAARVLQGDGHMLPCGRGNVSEELFTHFGDARDRSPQTLFTA
jgi:hypothetical protein